MPESNYYGGTSTQIVSGQVTAQQFSALLTRVQTVENSLSALSTTVGSSSSGLVKSVNDLSSAVSDLQTVVGDSSAGLVKRVSDLEAAAEGSESSGSENSGSGGTE